MTPKEQINGKSGQRQQRQQRQRIGVAMGKGEKGATGAKDQGQRRSAC